MGTRGPWLWSESPFPGQHGAHAPTHEAQPGLQDRRLLQLSLSTLGSRSCRTPCVCLGQGQAHVPATDLERMSHSHPLCLGGESC